MPDVNVKGRYRIYTHDGTTPLNFATTYSSQLCSIRRPNPNTFITISQYVPGSLSPFTTFDPGSSYTIVTRSNTANFSMGPYTRVDRLPSSATFKSPNFYHGLDKNSITVAITSYALSENLPLNTVFTYIPDANGYSVNSISFDTARYNQGLPSLLTHLTPGSSYQFKNRTPFTFFAPLQSEMGDAYASGDNNGAYGMGYYLDGNSLYLGGDNIYGIWDKISIGGSNIVEGSIYGRHVLALSACGNVKKLFVTGSNNYGQLGTGDSRSRSVWTAIPGEWMDIAAGYYSSHALSANGKLFSTGYNQYGQLGITDTSVVSASTFTQESLKGTWAKIAAGGMSLLALSSNGKLFGCGYNELGTLGIKNYTPKIYTLTQEASGGVFKNIYTRGSYSFAISGSFNISGGRLLGTGNTNLTYVLGIGWVSSVNTFVPELCGFTNVTDVYFGRDSAVFIKTNEPPPGDGSIPALRAAGYNFKNQYLCLRDYNNSSYRATFEPTNIPNDIKAFAWDGSKFNFINLNNQLQYIQSKKYDGTGYPIITTDKNYFNLFNNYNNSNTIFALSARNDLRPTPTPTVTPSSTPYVLYPPFNVSEVGIFGGSFQSSSTTTSMQFHISNTPGNLNNLFSYEQTNYFKSPPGATFLTTFDYEKTTEFNNIIGVSWAETNSYWPAGRYNCKFFWKRIGTNWTYTLLPVDFDGGRYYVSSEGGTDSLFIAPPHPSYPNGDTAQGVYILGYPVIPYNSSTSSGNVYNIAISYDRGTTWRFSTLLYGVGYRQYSLGSGSKDKMIFSRSRNSDYTVRLVGYSGGSSSIQGIGYQQLFYFNAIFPGSSNAEIVDSYVSGIFGFDFKHDYYNIPTVASVAGNQIRLSRRINGNWQTNVILNNISDVCQGPSYYVPGNGPLAFYTRLSSPVMSIEFDSTNADLVYVAYLRSTSYFASTQDPAKINVCCYNMRTNTLVYDEPVVSAKFETGSLQKVNAQYIDIPTLYFDTSNNTLNLIFFGLEFNGLNYPSSPGGTVHRYFKTTRAGTNSWSAASYVFDDPIKWPNSYKGYEGSQMSNSWELKTKY
jgi:hypothetical protein